MIIIGPILRDLGKAALMALVTAAIGKAVDKVVDKI